MIHPAVKTLQLLDQNTQSYNLSGLTIGVQLLEPSNGFGIEDLPFGGLTPPGGLFRC